MKCSAYVRVDSVQDALGAAEQYGEQAIFVAGATDVAVRARQGEPYANAAVIDLSSIAELARITEEEEVIRIGALCTHTQIHRSPLINRHCRILAMACLEVGSPQIRNRGTLGGNIANASPAADSLPALAALHAQVVLRRGGCERRLPLDDFVCGAYQTALRPGELITEILVDKLPRDARHHYHKVARRNALAISRLSVACAAGKNAAGEVTLLRLAVGSVFPKPLVFEQLHRELLGRRPTPQAVRELAEQVADQIPEQSGVRASTPYKQPVTRAVVARGLMDIMEVC